MGDASDSASFRKPAEAYDRFVGRYGQPLALSLTKMAGLRPGWKVLDVGCGPGQLTAVLAELVGAAHVAAVDPSEPFTLACIERVPGADVRVASAEDLPFEDDSFDATFSQLVVNFLADAAAGLGEMRRVTTAGGRIAACVWDYAGRMTMLRAFWDAAIRLDPGNAGPLDEGTRMPYSRPEDLARLWSEAGLTEVKTGELTVAARYTDFEDLWGPFTTGVGPAGAYCASLREADRAALKEAYRDQLGSPEGTFELSARAWFALGVVPRD